MTTVMKVLISALLLSAWSTSAQAAQCDVNNDGFIDLTDVRSITQARGQPATGPDDPRDANGDGTITVNDARACTIQCDLARCAVQPDPEDVAVPDVVGFTEAAATAAINGANLNVAAITVANSDTAPVGTVISQDPAAGSLVAPGSGVDLVISIGPEDVAVPDVVGQVQAAAEAAIAGAGLNVGNVTTAGSNTVPAGSVISQNPSGGSLVAPGSNIDLVVSTGPDDVAVPDVVGLSEAAATADINGAGLSVAAIITANSNTAPIGTVISQDPAAGSLVAPGSNVDLVISIGPEDVAVPDVVGQAQAAAEATITGAGFLVGNVTTANSDTVAAGNVISQNPIGGSLAAPGSNVDLVVSIGPEDVAVPDVVGQAQAAAEATITGAGFLVGNVTTANSDTVAAGSVISQNPIGGSLAAPGSDVDLVVSIGPEDIPVPDVVGLTQAAATTALTDDGLVVGVVTLQNSDTVPAGNVISQDPNAGTNVAPGSAVNLVVSDGEALVTVPNVVGLAEEDAEAALVAGANLVIGTVEFVTNETVPAGDVISQNPAAGAEVPPGSPVDLVVSLGPEVVVIDSVTADVDPEFLPIDGIGNVVCKALDINGVEILPTPDFAITTTAPAVINGTEFSSSVDDEYIVTCDLIGDVLTADAPVVVLPPDVDPSYGEVQNSFENLADLSQAVDAANEAEDVPALQALKGSIQAEIATIDIPALVANPPLPDDDNRPTDQQLIDELGDAPNPAIDDPWKAQVMNYRANVMAYRAKLAAIDPSNATEADVQELLDLTTELNAIGDAVENVVPSHTAVLAMNDEINELYTDLVPNEAIENSQETIGIINTVDGIVGVDHNRWQLQYDSPADLYAGIQIASVDSAEYHKGHAEAFSFISVMTSQAIAGSLRKIAGKVYKQILNSWKRTAKAIRNLDPPIGIDPPILSFVLPSFFPDNSPFQILLAGSNFVAGNTTVSVVPIVSGLEGAPRTAPVFTSGGNDDAALADMPALGLFCNIFTACAAKVTVITPGGTSNEIAVNVQ